MKSTDKKFYTYIYLDPRKKGRYSYQNLDISFLYEPIYVGKGCLNKSGTNRMYSHIKDSYRIFNKGNQLKFNKIRKIIKETETPPITLKIKDELTEKQAHCLESKLITSIGRYDLKQGPLTNLTNGGEGSIGWIPSDEVRKNMSNSQKGRKHTIKTKEKIRKYNLENDQTIYLKQWRETATEEELEAWRKKRMGEKNGFYGKKWSEKERKRLSEMAKSRNLVRSKNPSAKLYIAIDPNGQIYILNGTFKKFCKNNKLTDHKFREHINKGIIHSNRSDCRIKGWELVNPTLDSSPSNIKIFNMIFDSKSKII